jgi:hypothetical protein
MLNFHEERAGLKPWLSIGTGNFVPELTMR